MVKEARGAISPSPSLRNRREKELSKGRRGGTQRRKSDGKQTHYQKNRWQAKARLHHVSESMKKPERFANLKRGSMGAASTGAKMRLDASKYRTTGERYCREEAEKESCGRSEASSKKKYLSISKLSRAPRKFGEKGFWKGGLRN